MKMMKFVLMLGLGIFVTGWFGESLLYSQLQKNEKNRIADDLHLRQLAEGSDFIGVVKLVSQQFLVDPEVWKTEINKSANSNSLGKINLSVKGVVYELEVIDTILSLPLSEKRRSIKVYSVGDPFALHSGIVRYLPSREYLLFAKRAKNSDLQTQLETVNPQSPLTTTKTPASSFFLVTEPSDRERPFENDNQVVDKVKRMVKSLRRQ